MKQVNASSAKPDALEPIKDLLREVGAHGWTHFTVEGAGQGASAPAR